MKTFIGVGIDKHDDDWITPLNGAANDTNQLAFFFKHRPGFETRALIRLIAGELAEP